MSLMYLYGFVKFHNCLAQYSQTGLGAALGQSWSYTCQGGFILFY